MPTKAEPSAGEALRALATAIAESAAETLPDSTIEAARQRVFDALGAAALGMATPEGRALLRCDAPLRPAGAPREALDRVRRYVGAARTTEIDDIDVASCTTVGSVVVPAALALAAAVPGGGDALLAAVIAGYEAMTRLGRAIGGATLLYSGVWPTYVTAGFGAAAAASKVLGLDAARTGGALASALARTSALPSRSAASFGFRYHALGSAALEGCMAALAARAGIVADAADVASFERRTGAAVDAAELVEGLGRDWRILEVDTKMLPSSRQALASIEAFLALGLKGDGVEQIERVTVAVPAAYRDMIDRSSQPTQRIESLIGVQYALALAALHPEALHDALRQRLPSGERIASFMARIDVRTDAELSEQFPRRWGSRVVVRSTSGEETAAEVLEPRGSGRRALDWDELRRKHERIFDASGISGVDLASPLRRCAELRDGTPGAAVELLAWLDARAAALEAGEAP